MADPIIGLYPQDVLTHIYNVHWGGGAVFVIGDDSGQIWRCTAGKDIKPNFQKMIQQFGVDNAPNGISPGQCNGGSFALVKDKDNKDIPTFVLTGIDNQFDSIEPDGLGSGLFTDGIIMISGDGITWTKVFDTATSLGGERRTPRRVIWDETEKKFYVDMAYRSPTLLGEDSTLATECWSSADGRAWTMAGSLPDDVPNTIFDAHCKYKWSASYGGIGFENGHFGINPAKKGSTEPPVLGKIVEDGLLITEEDLVPTTKGGINFAGGLWGCGDSTKDANVFEVSSDDGATWTIQGAVVAYDPADPRYGRINIICAGVPAPPAAPAPSHARL
jgi:hypothetical protein